MTQVVGTSSSSAVSAVLGQNTASGTGVEGQGYVCVRCTPNVAGGYGVYASDGGYANVWSLYGNSYGSGGYALYTSCSGSSQYAAYHYNGSTGSSTSQVYALYCSDGCLNSYSYAIRAVGRVSVSSGGIWGDTGIYSTGTNGVSSTYDVYKRTCYFRIDHPTDPENKYLMHASVESDQMKTMYTGEVTLDAKGCAEVSMPSWFELVNDNCQCLVTPLDAAMPGLFTSRVSGGKFTVSGGLPNGTVFWQVTGVRKDAPALENPMQVEKPKNADEQGKFLHPHLFGFGPERGMHFQSHAVPCADHK